MTLPTYVLITPARNEAAFVELTIQSVVAQTVRPLKWVIVSDGSTDDTDDIVRKYLQDNPWIELLRIPDRKERHFAGKVLAFNAGYEHVKHLAFEVVGSLDADISFDSTYFAFLLEKLAVDSRLGLVGTRFTDPANFTYDYRFSNIEYVTGCCQLFRRACFEDIGGYLAVKGGAIDRIANIAARMNAWGTRTFLDESYLHHRTFGTAEAGPLVAKFKDGAKDFAVGTHPMWMFFRVIYQTRNRPYLIGALALAWGYIYPYLTRKQRPVSRDLIQFNRSDQMRRLRRFLIGRTVRTLGSS